MSRASTGSDVPVLLKLDAAARIALAVTALISVTILGAWLFPALASLLPHGWDLMKVNTAIGMLLGAAGMWASASPSSPGTSASRIFAATLSLLALLILLEHVTGLQLHMDTWLAMDAASPNPGMTSARAATGLLFIGLLIPCMKERRGALCTAADALTFTLVGLVLILLSGYFYGSARLVGESSLILVSPQTLTCFLLLAFVAVVRRVEYGWLSTLFGSSRVGRVVAITAPLVITLIYTTGFFYIYVRQKELLSRSDAVALSVALLSMVVLYVILLMAGRINRLEQSVRDLMLGKSHAELQESEQRYSELVEQAITGFVVRRPDGQLILVNEAYRSMTGYSREELLTLKAKDLVADTTVLEKVARLQPGESTRIETLLKRKDGSLLEVQYVTQRLRNGNLQSVLLDVSERKRAEKAHAESEQRYAELVDQALEGITVRKPTGEFIFVNDTFCSMLGYTHAELLGMSITDVVHPEDVETIRQVQRLTSGGSLWLEKRMLRKDGRILYVEVSARRLRDGNFQSTVQDISERKRSEERFRGMVEGAPNAMIMVGEEGAISMVNTQAERLFGYTRGEMLQMSIDMLVPERFRTGHPKLRAGYNHDPRMRAMGVGRDLYGLRKDGIEVPVEIGLNPITTHDGHFVLASIIDITERRAAEKRDHLYQEELRLMSQRLLETQETERRAIARELHDEIGQALTATRMNLRDLEQQAGDGPLKQRAADASAIVAHLLQQVRQLSLDLHPTVLDDLGLAASLRWLIRTRLGSSELNVIQELAEDLPRFTSAAEHTLFRVFQEAMSNVLRHSGARNLEVKLTLVGSDLQLDIRDDGKGFDPGEARKHALAGASLGVIGMQERVRLAGGRIVIESKPGQGTRIQLSLPAVERQDT